MDEIAPAEARERPRHPEQTDATAGGAPLTGGAAGLRRELTRLRRDLDQSNATLLRLLRELEDRGPNAPSVPKLWEGVRHAAARSDQLIQRLDRLRAELTAQESAV